MGLEIERKFLVASPDWQTLTPSRVICFRQGYLAIGGGPENLPEDRVRFYDLLEGVASVSPVAHLTIKGQGSRTRQEIEFEVPSHDYDPALSEWVGQEASDDKSFKNARLATSRWTGGGLATRQEQPAARPRGPGA